MKRTRSVFLALAGSAGFAALVVAACGSDYEVTDDFCRRNPSHPECPPPGFAGSSGASGTAGQGPGGTSGNAGQGPGGSAGVSGSGGSGGGASGTGGSGPMPTVCDPAEQPNDAKGIFVDASAPAGGKGTRAEPYSSLPAAVAALTNLPSASGATLYLRQGAAPYALDATLELPPMTEGVGLVLDGGWSESWQRDCSDEAASKTIVSGKSATASPVLRAEGGSLTLRRLTVQTVDATDAPIKSQPGASLVAVYVTGATSLLADTATLRAGRAGDGGAAAPTTPGSGAQACNGRTDCSSGTSAATPGPPGGTNAAALTSVGFVPGDGQDGQPGDNGQNGLPGGNGVENSDCFLCEGATQAACEASSLPPFTDSISANGRCGCGGKGGAQGRGGKGGGASIALWVGSPTARIAVARSQIAAGEGGQGSTGGQGVNGTTGTGGIEGAPQCRAPQGKADCVWSVNSQACVVIPASLLDNLSIGTPGGPGGNGSRGGNGGPGAGGPSYALVAPNSATIQIDATSTLTTGQGGLGGDGVTIAEAAPQKTY